MAEPFYTLNLGRTYGPKLVEALAAQASYEEVEAFAALILCYVLGLVNVNETNPEADGDLGDGTLF